jgi:hypothetical protein
VVAAIYKVIASPQLSALRHPQKTVLTIAGIAMLRDLPPAILKRHTIAGTSEG